MLETQLCNRRVILRFKRAFERANRTDFAVAIQQRVANRTRSSVCGFHGPGRASVRPLRQPTGCDLTSDVHA